MDPTDLFKAMVWDKLVELALAQLFAAAPFLAWGPFGVIVAWVIRMYADKLYAAGKMEASLELIGFKNELARKAFEASQLKLKLVARDKGVESAEFKAERENHKRELSQFARFGVAR